MALRNSVRIRLGVLIAGVALGGLLAITPIEGQQIVVGQVKTPTISVAKVPSPGIPFVTKPQPAPLQMQVMSPDQVAAYTEAAVRRLPYLPGQLLVKFKPGVGREGRQRFLNTLPSQPDVDGVEWIAPDIALLKNMGAIDPEQMAQRVSAESEIAWAEPNYLQKPHFVPTDPSYTNRQWNFFNIGMQRAWDIAPGGSASVIVAVVDTGITTFPVTTINVQTWSGTAIVTHPMPAGLSPDFTTNRFTDPRDFNITPSSPTTTVVDTDAHGSHVAGTIGENTNNGVSLAGIAFNTTIMPLKACASYWDVQFARSAAGITGFTPIGSGGCSTSSTAAAVRYAADHGAKVINYSIGGNSPSLTMRDAYAYAVARGVFIAVSNGNDFEDGNLPSYPAAYAPEFKGVMSVASTNLNERRSYYSTTGSYTEIAAPGGDGRQGAIIWQASIRFSDSTEGVVIFPRFDRYDERGLQGTSMASPHIAGIAALLVSRGVTDPADIESILRQSVKDIGAAGRDNEFGFGLVQPFKALFGQGVAR